MFREHQIAEAMRRSGYAVFDNEGKGYNLNLFGIRSDDLTPNTFNDTFGVLYKSAGRWVLFEFPATTDPGVYWRRSPMNVNGTAILVPGQYRGAYQIGEHKGYPALVQRRPVRVYRDNDGDAQLDLTAPIDVGMFGINIHRASASARSVEVGKWSAGCQVVADPAHFDLLMALAARARARYGTAITYTLLTDADFVG